MDFRKNYYKILGVEETATEAEIKLAYRKLAILYHPDHNPDNPEFEERTKEINEAKEVLLNYEERFVYDEYRRQQRRESQPGTSLRQKAATSTESSKRTTVRKRTVSEESRIYVTGQINIKYTAPQDMTRFDFSLRESYYLIQPTEVSAEIDRKDCIWSRTDPPQFANVFATHPVFQMNIAQPVPTRMKDGEVYSHYSLWIHALRVPNATIELVTKHENQSFGTITGEFFGYVHRFDTKEVTETFEENDPEPQQHNFAGETGIWEDKFEEGAKYRHKQYYYADGTAFWGQWVRVPVTPRRRTPVGIQGGCVNSGIGIVIAIALIAWLIFSAPHILPILIFYFLLALLGRFGNGRVGNILGLLLLLFYIGGLIYLLAKEKPSSGSPRSTTRTESIREKRSPRIVPFKDTSLPSDSQQDTLITRYREWKDYDGQLYAGNYSFRSSHLRQAGNYKNGLLLPTASPAEYDRVIYLLKQYDRLSLNGAYHLFDSLRTANHLTQTGFAEMIMSFVQDIPYSIILDSACDPALYNDMFIRRYLATPGALCEPYQRFGIYSPLEFLANLNGDCDSRTLFTYEVLAHYGYDVVLLSSEAYRHSLIGISLPYQGKAYEFANTRYIVWETTAEHARPGILPTEVSNMRLWRISLRNQP
jgi:hypothetical protein